MSTAFLTAGILVLAAGRSQRFGLDKRLARLPVNGQTLLEATVAAAHSSGLPVRVCLRPGDVRLAQHLAAPGVATVFCERAEAGMGATLAEAIAGVRNSWQAAVITLGDMPLVTVDTYRRLASACEANSIVVPHFRGQRGNPVCFGSAWFTALQRCDGDRGARDILRAHPHAITALDVDDAGILKDVDYPADIDAMH